jgi:hypothetical protein
MTEFGLVLIFVIESLYSVVSSSTLIFLGTFFCVSEFAKLWGVVIIIPPLVLD